MRDPVKIYFGLLKIQVKILDKFKARDFNATSLSTHEVSTLYTTLPYYLIEINLWILLKEPSIEKALLTLHVTTGTHFLLKKTNKKQYHAWSCQNVCDALTLFCTIFLFNLEPS